MRGLPGRSNNHPGMQAILFSGKYNCPVIFFKYFANILKYYLLSSLKNLTLKKESVIFNSQKNINRLKILQTPGSGQNINLLQVWIFLVKPDIYLIYFFFKIRIFLINGITFS